MKSKSTNTTPYVLFAIGLVLSIVLVIAMNILLIMY